MWRHIEEVPVSRRAFLAGGATTLAAIAAACTGGRTIPAPSPYFREPRNVPTQPSLDELQAATGLPKDAALRVWRGFHPERAGRPQDRCE